MKTMKKLLALVMALALCLSLGVCAMASEVTATSDSETVSLPKTYSMTGTAAEETFYLVQVGNGTVSQSSDDTATAPALDSVSASITVEQGQTVVSSLTLSSTNANGDFVIGLPSYETVGVYTYELKEISSTSTGVTTYDGSFYLVVYVTNSETSKNTLEVSQKLFYSDSEAKEKLESITNTYGSGTLSVTKYVSGAFADKEKTFEITIKLTAPADTTVKNTISYTVAGGTAVEIAGGWTGSKEIKVELSDSDTVTFTNIPAGVTYEVSEADYENYSASIDYTDTTKAIASDDEDTVTVTNTNGDTVPETGITLDSLPYVLVLVAVLALGAVMIIRKRRVED